MLERQREGGRDVEAGRQMIFSFFLGGGSILADFSFFSLFIQICFHPLADRTNMQKHNVESGHTAQCLKSVLRRSNVHIYIYI